MGPNDLSQRLTLDVIKGAGIPNEPKGCRVLAERPLDKDTDEPEDMERCFVVVQFDSDPKDKAWGFPIVIRFDADHNVVDVELDEGDVLATGYDLEGTEVRQDQIAA